LTRVAASATVPNTHHPGSTWTAGTPGKLLITGIAGDGSPIFAFPPDLVRACTDWPREGDVLVHGEGAPWAPPGYVPGGEMAHAIENDTTKGRTS